MNYFTAMKLSKKKHTYKILSWKVLINHCFLTIVNSWIALNEFFLENFHFLQETNVEKSEKKELFFIFITNKIIY